MLGYKTQGLHIPSPVQYLVGEDGQRTGVVLDWHDYQSLQLALGNSSDLLVGLSAAELRALAEGVLSPQRQERLNELLQRNRESELTDSEQHELDQLVEHLDHLNTLKARAMYTLQELSHQRG